MVPSVPCSSTSPSHQTGAKDETPWVPGCGLCLVGRASLRAHVWNKKWVKDDLHGQPLAQQPPNWLTAWSCSHLEGAGVGLLSFGVPYTPASTWGGGPRVSRWGHTFPAPNALLLALKALRVGGSCQPTSCLGCSSELPWLGRHHHREQNRLLLNWLYYCKTQRQMKSLIEREGESF